MPTLVFLVTLSALPILFLAPLFGAPMERDQGVYATIASGWMDGGLPYRDLWDNKAPLLFLWYAVSFTLVGDSAAAVQFMAAVSTGFCVPFVWATANILFGRREASIAAVLFALSFANIYLQVTANAEAFMLLPMTAGLWAFTVGTRRGSGTGFGWFLLAGTLTALAVFTRQSAIWAFAGYGTWFCAMFITQPDNRLQQLNRVVGIAIGTVLGSLPFVIYFAVYGELYALWYAMFEFNTSWAAVQSWWLKFVPPLLIEPGPLLGGLLFWLLVIMGVPQLWKLGGSARWVVLPSLFFAQAAAHTMGKGSAHYSIQLLPTASIAAVFGLITLVQLWREKDRAFKLSVALVSLVTLGALTFAYTRPTVNERFEVQYTYRDYADDAIAAPAIASAVAAISSEDECIYEWGRSSQIYYLADRSPCVRWLHNRAYEVDPLVMNEVMAGLRLSSPEVVLVTSQDVPVPPPLEMFIRDEYRYLGQVEYAVLYKRRL